MRPPEANNPGMSRVTAAIDAVARGGIVVVVDDEDPDSEGVLVMAAAAATTEAVAFFLAHTSGMICVGLEPERCDALDLPMMVERDGEAQPPAFTVSVDLVAGISTGISAADRATTIRALAAPDTSPADLARPGHVFPLRSRPGGVLKRAGHTEAAVDLARLAGRPAAGVLCDVVTLDKSGMARADDLRALADDHGLVLVSIADLIRHRHATEWLVDKVSAAPVTTRAGEFVCHTWRSRFDDTDHLALVRGTVDGDQPVLVRVHSECLTGDVFGSRRCDCGPQLDEAIDAVAAAGAGVVVYLRGHEGRGIGLAHKLEAYQLQDAGHDTVDANLLLGLPVDDREYGIGAQMLMDLGVRRMRLMTNNPAKYRGLSGYGIEIVERVPMTLRVTPENVKYLDTKRRRMGHL